MIAECAAEAIKFKWLADDEKNPELKAALEKQATAYRKLAIDRAKKLGIPAPEFPSEKDRDNKAN